MTTAKEYGEQLYDAAVLTAGAVAVSYASRKLTKDTLGVPMTLNGSAKLALAFGLSAIGVKILKDKKFFRIILSKHRKNLHNKKRMTDMLRLSAEVHSKIILQAVPDVTNEELNDIIYKYSFVNPIYYPEWWSVKRFVSTSKNNIDADYKKLVMRTIKSSNPIRLAIIESLALLGNDDDDDLIDFRIDECVDEHERLVMRMRNPYYVNYSEDDD